MNARAARRCPRLARPAAALAVGILSLVMLAAVAVLSSMAHQTRLSWWTGPASRDPQA